MRKRIAQSVFVLCALAIAMLSAGTAWTQTASEEKPPLYTYVSEWAVPRAMWGDYQKMQATDDAGMNKLLADGTITSYGSYSILNHQEGLPTHGSWFSARSMANLMKALEAERATPDSTGPILSASKHWDFTFQSRDYSAHPATLRTATSASATGNSRPARTIPTAKS